MLLLNGSPKGDKSNTLRVAPALTGAFTTRFMKWYPAKVARG